MLDIIITEFHKIKRYNILWVGVVAALFSVLLALFQIVSSHGSDPLTYESFANGVIWNNFSLAFPFGITIIGGYLINREYTDQTLKNILTVPISLRKLLAGKLIMVGGLTILLSLFSFLCTVILGLIFCNINISITLVVKSLGQILAVNLCCYVAVLPIIAYFGHKQNAFLTGVGIAFVYGFCGVFVAGRKLTDFYPITAGLGLVGYDNGTGSVYQPLIGVVTLVVILILTTILLAFTPNYDKVMTTSKKKGTKHKKYSHK
ncbi:MULTISPECIES: ABC transporter permease [unclassified Clostridioides]|uniref:ABC transporter permease n=1 Tax=unclassified Clostridioides TaxID=2635829 RepID=UPI001D123A64|nr:ABC transporter permease [Clostridioides sp. ES-S-0171-01]MCC0686825.1 ABC transporter permease [Clostridioides sp. ES-S-0056-01]MCC0713661.1 ABC transporter permease [Clostridioides sp. ES-S-0077-01]UDN55399.1 ABC transporter permease [Clostridioides sp. ES-S-0054-01]